MLHTSGVQADPDLLNPCQDVPRSLQPELNAFLGGSAAGAEGHHAGDPKLIDADRPCFGGFGALGLRPLGAAGSATSSRHGYF